MKLPDKYFLYVGNAYPHKNLERLLMAFADLKRQVPDIKLVLVGAEDFFYKRLKKQVIKIGFNEEVIFYGEVNRKEIDSLYQKAIALIFPSLMEGFGLPGLEALKNGCLVLASDIPVFHEVLGEAVFYFNPSDISDIRRGMEKGLSYLQEQNSKGGLREKGLRQVKKYSWEQMAQQTLNIYQKILTQEKG